MLPVAMLTFMGFFSAICIILHLIFMLVLDIEEKVGHNHGLDNWKE